LLLLDSGRIKTVAENLKAIDEMAERMGRITLQLKSFARKGASIATPVDLDAAVKSVLLLLEHRLRAERVEVQVDLTPGLQVRGDTNRLEQVLLNLATNALDAMADSTSRRLSIASMLVDGRVVVSVADTGAGMDEEHFGRLFEPFFTTKPAGQGLGLGLVISSKIIREFGGTLRAHRGEREGMVFEFDLEAVRKEIYV
jgi:two-component system C4-dicarboxylate transport sensor histidine kinase DctB